MLLLDVVAPKVIVDADGALNVGEPKAKFAAGLSSDVLEPKAKLEDGKGLLAPDAKLGTDVLADVLKENGKLPDGAEPVVADTCSDAVVVGKLGAVILSAELFAPKVNIGKGEDVASAEDALLAKDEVICAELDATLKMLLTLVKLLPKSLRGFDTS